MWVKLVAVVLVVEPSPKSQKRLVIVPVELSVKVTTKGSKPAVGLAEKCAAGIRAPVPVSVFVLAPALAELTTRLLVKLAALPGMNWTTTLVEPKPVRLNAAPDKIRNGPGVTVAVPLVKAAPPVLVTTKVVCALVPIATMPKSKLGGDTTSWAGVRLEPVTVFVLLPPLLTKTTTLLKLAASWSLIDSNSLSAP